MPLIANRSLKKRLLELFPLQILKDHFNQQGSMDAITEVISSDIDQNIQDFVFRFQGMTRQNIFLFRLNRNFKQIDDMVNFPLTIGAESHENNVHSYIFFLEITYTVYLNEPVQTDQTSFIQPVVMTIIGQNMTISFTKLAKDIKSYFPRDRSPRLLSETNVESSTIDKIISHFSSLIGITVNDFNKGLKHMWEVDDLDCIKISYLDGFATIIYNMNVNLTFKQQYPVKYEEMKNDPISDSLWKVLANNESLLPAFRCNPTLGILNIGKFSDNPNQTSNVIARILAEN